MTNHFFFRNFWGLSASMLGTYEAVSFLTKLSKKGTLPTVSTFCSKKKRRRLLMVLWTVGLAVHIWRHQPNVI